MFDTPPRRHPLQTAQFWFLTLFGVLSVAAWKMDLFDFGPNRPELPVITDEPMPPPPAISDDEFGDWNDFVPAPQQSEQQMVENTRAISAPPAMAPQQAAEEASRSTSTFSLQEKPILSPTASAEQRSFSAQVPRPVKVASEDATVIPATGIGNPSPNIPVPQQVEAPRPYDDWTAPSPADPRPSSAVQKASWDVNLEQTPKRFERKGTQTSTMTAGWGTESNTAPSPYYPVPEQNSADADPPTEQTVNAASFKTSEPSAAPSAAPAVTMPEHDAQAILQEAETLLQTGDDVSAHRLLSSWYWKAPELRPQLDNSLNMLARRIYFQPEPHYLEPHYYQATDSLEALAAECQVTVQYFSKLNRLTEEPLQPGRQLKRIQGPFSVVVDLTRNDLTIHAHGYYVTRFALPEATHQSAFPGMFSLTKVSMSASEFGAPSHPTLVLSDAAGSLGELQIVPIGVEDGTPSLKLDPTMVAALSNLLVPGSEVIIRR